MSSDILSAFQHLIGAKVAVKKKVTEKTFKFIPQPVKITDYIVAEDDPIIEEIGKLAKDAGFKKVRRWLPTTVGTMDHNVERLNVTIADDGTIEKITIG